ncbi:MAG: TetR/AcrR family transcriptional regulator [Planctomycetota bacterium]|nr:MAG: TetR/AcrR family transcriptional regulator [Planctomycetota bacterium]
MSHKKKSPGRNTALVGRKSRAKRGRPLQSVAGEISTEQRLLDGALTLFADKGYTATTTRDIIDAAGVTKPVLYHYFSSKESLFRRLVGGIYESGERAWEEILATETTAAGRLRGMIRVSFAGCSRDPRIPRLMFQTHYGPQIPELREFMEGHTARRFGQVLRVMNEGLAAGDLRGGDAAGLALVFCCLMDQHINILARMPAAASLLSPDRADALSATFFDGCGTGRRRGSTLPRLA